MAKYAASYDFSQDPDRIYGILSDVERMSEFMPLCKRSEVLSRHTTDDGEVVEANVLLRYRQIDFEREVDLVLTLRPSERRIDVAMADTTLGSGTARWTVIGVGQSGSQVLFESDYKIGNFLLRTLLGKRLVLLGTNRIIDRVRQRAETLEGR